MNEGRELVVHRVASPDEARRFEEAGADIIGVVLEPEVGPWAGDGRAVTPTGAASIARALSTASLLVEVPDGVLLDTLGSLPLTAGWLQIPSFSVRSIGSGGGRWVVGRVEADEDADPQWIESALDAAEGAQRAVLEVCAAFDDPLAILETGAVDDGLSVADLGRLCRRRPLWLSLGLRAERVRRALAAWPTAAGWVWNLGDPASGGGSAHLVQPDDAAAAIRAMRALSPPPGR